MQRTWFQRVFFIGGWTVAFLSCVLTGLSAYTIGYFDGSIDSNPLGTRQSITVADVVRTIGFALDAPAPSPAQLRASQRSSDVPKSIEAIR